MCLDTRSTSYNEDINKQIVFLFLFVYAYFIIVFHKHALHITHTWIKKTFSFSIVKLI